MKIGISSNALKHSGGLERYAMDLVRGFVAAGLRPAFFARQFDQDVPETGMVDAHRINVLFVPGKLRDGWFARRLRAARRASRVDVLIGCNRVDMSEIAICGGTHRGFLRATGRPPTWSDRHQIELESRQYENAQVVVAHSDLMHDELRTLYGVDEAKIRVLYPPVDGARFKPVAAQKRAALRHRYGFADDEIVLLFPSSSHERKGLPLIEAALRDLGLPVVLAVAGRAPPHTSKQIRYIGYAKDIEDCYRAADFTILASSYEPFGLVGIESVMCGTPVIFPSSIGCGNAIAPHAKFMFTPDDVASLRDTIVRAVEWRRGQSQGQGNDVPQTVALGAVCYDATVRAHVDELLALANRIVAER